MGHERELSVAGKSMARQVVLLPVYGVGVVFHTAHDGEKNGRAARPVCWIGLPEVLASLVIGNTLEFGSHFCDFNSQFFIA